MVLEITKWHPAAKAVFPDIEAAMKSESAKMNLQYDKAENWAAKCVQLLESYYVRHGIGIVGPTGSGKTVRSVIKPLSSSSSSRYGILEKIYKKHTLQRKTKSILYLKLTRHCHVTL